MINKQRLVDTFIEIVKIDSPSGHEEKMVDFVTKFFENIGVENNLDSYGNVIARVNKGRFTTDPIMLSAHLDTVEPGRNIRPQIVNGIISSKSNTILGADNKAGVAAILEATRTIIEQDIPTRPLEIVFTLSEEVGNYGAVNLDYKALKSKIGFTFDSGSSLGTLTMAAPFYNRFDVTVRGKACHAGHPEGGINALTIVAKALNNLTFGRIDTDTVCNVGVIQGGNARNTVPDEISLKGEVRSFLETKLTDVSNKIEAEFVKTVQQMGGAATVEFVRENGGFKMNKDQKSVQIGIKAVEFLGLTPIFKETTSCYDANIFHEKGLEVLNFGNGSKNNHTTKECISTEDLETTAKLVLTLCRL